MKARHPAHPAGCTTRARLAAVVAAPGRHNTKPSNAHYLGSDEEDAIADLAN